MFFRSPFRLLAVVFLSVGSIFSCFGAEPSRLENPADFPLMGDWEGSLTIPGRKAHKQPSIAAQLICIDQTQYRLRILPALNRRAEAYVDTTVSIEGDRFEYKAKGWQLVFENGICTGTRGEGDKQARVEMKKREQFSPTLGQKAPKGAIVLGFDDWEHPKSRPLTWNRLDDGGMEIVSIHWNDGENRKKEIGGSAVTKRRFGSMHLHLEFRYPVEIGKKDQKKGNSGLFISGFGEIQILNSYGSVGHWNECGAFYRNLPPKVNAAAPPLQWQTYDVEVRLPEPNSGKTTGYMSVRHNGHVIHKLVPFEVGKRKDIGFTLQDHSNAIQFRNIWVKES